MPTVPSFLAVNYPPTPAVNQIPDFSLLKNVGISKIRISAPDYEDAGYIADSRAAVLKAKSYGFYVLYGVSSNSLNNGDYAITVHNWADYVTGATAEAIWAQANGVDEFEVGNEEEVHNFKLVGTGQLTRSGSTATCALTSKHNMVNGDTVTVLYAVQIEYNGAHVITRIDDYTFTYTVSGTPASPATGPIQAYGMTDTVLQTNLRALVTTVKGVFSGKVSYATHPYRIFDWINNIGTLDYIGYNIYGSPTDPIYSYPYFKYAVTKCLRNFGNKFILYEFNVSPSWGTGDYGTEAQFASNLANQIAFLTKIGLPLAYFFSYTHGNFGVLDSGGVIRPAYWSLFGVTEGTA